MAQLETDEYYQGQQSVDEYINSFRDLIELAGYTTGLAIVVKFCRGLQKDIQDQIAHMGIRCLPDDNPDAWYEAAI